MNFFCTYFDRNYLPLGMTLMQSLRKHAAPCKLFVLCLDDETHDALTGLQREDIVPVALSDVEAHLPRLRDAKANRSRIEYYFTLTPALPFYLLRVHPEIDVLSYVDSDLYLFGRFAAVLEELGTGSVLIVKHGFESVDSPKNISRGKYNVGLLTFRNDANGHACLAWWHERCLEWCYDRAEDGKYADQRYLDEFPTRFAGVVVSNNIGAHAGPWNFQLSNYLTRRGRSFYIKDNELLFYHFHALRVITPRVVDTGITYSHIQWSRALLQVYHEYTRELLRALASATCRAVRTGSNVRYAPGNLKLLDYLLNRRVFVRIGPWTVYVFMGTAAQRAGRARMKFFELVARNWRRIFAKAQG